MTQFKNLAAFTLFAVSLFASVVSAAGSNLFEFKSANVPPGSVAIEYYGALSGIYQGKDNLFFKGADTVHVYFVGELRDSKMVNGAAEIKDEERHVSYTGNIVNGVMQDDHAEATRVKSKKSMEFFSGSFNGYEFDSCFYANSGTSERYIGKMSNGKFNDVSASYVGPLYRIYNGDLSSYAIQSDFFDFSPVNFSSKDMATFQGAMRDGRIADFGTLSVVHKGDTLHYTGDFENAQVNGVGTVKVGDLYSYVGHFAKGQIAGLGEITSDHFSRLFTESEHVPAGTISIKGIWAGISGLGTYFRVTDEDGANVKLRMNDGTIEELGYLQRFGNWVSETGVSEWIVSHRSEIDKVITGAAFVDAGVCASLLIFPASAPVTGPICGGGFFTIVGAEAALQLILTFDAINEQCYTEDCVEEMWKNFGKEQLFNAGLIMLPPVIARAGKAIAPTLKSYLATVKEFGYTRAIAMSKNAQAVKELEMLPEISLPRVREIDVLNDRLAFKQAVVDYTGKSFRDGFVEFFVRLKKSGQENLIKDIWQNHKNFIKNSGIRAGGEHEWLEADRFVDYLLNPKWGSDGAYLAYILPRMTQRTTGVKFANGGAHTIVDETGRKIPGPNSGSFHKTLGETIGSCNTASCVFSKMKSFASRELTSSSYKDYIAMERTVLE